MNAGRQRLLLKIVAALAAVKFLLLPWIDHQRDMVERVTVLTKRLDRATALVENQKKIIESLSKIEKSTLSARARFPQAVDLSSFRLNAQQSLTAAAAQRGFGLKVFEWVASGRLPAAGLEYSRARLQLEGGFRDIASFQAELESRFPNMIVRELTIGSSSSIRGPDDVLVSMSIVVDLYFRSAPVSSDAV